METGKKILVVVLVIILLIVAFYFLYWKNRKTTVAGAELKTDATNTTNGTSTNGTNSGTAIGSNGTTSEVILPPPPPPPAPKIATFGSVPTSQFVNGTYKFFIPITYSDRASEVIDVSIIDYKKQQLILQGYTIRTT